MEVHLSAGTHDDTEYVKNVCHFCVHMVVVSQNNDIFSQYVHLVLYNFINSSLRLSLHLALLTDEPPFRL